MVWISTPRRLTPISHRGDTQTGRGDGQLRDLETVQVEADQIREHPRNPRKGDVEAIKRSMQANGIYRPVIVQKTTGYILAGNHSYRAMRELGETQIPVVFVDVDDDTATRILLADNRTADLGEYDHETLIQLLQDIPDLDGTGYDEQDLQDILDETPDFQPVDEEPRLDEYLPLYCQKCGYDVKNNPEGLKEWKP